MVEPHIGITLSKAPALTTLTIRSPLRRTLQSRARAFSCEAKRELALNLSQSAKFFDYRRRIENELFSGFDTGHKVSGG
jgi:hypothetical protein